MKVFTPNWEGWEVDIRDLEKSIIIEADSISRQIGKSKGLNTYLSDESIFYGAEIKSKGNRAFSIKFESDIRTLLEIISDAGYSYVILDPDVLKEDEKLKDYFPQVNSFGEIQDTPDFETLQSLIRKVKLSEGVDRCGAIGTFTGIVRKDAGDREVKRLEYEINEDVFQTKLKEIEKKLKKYPGISDVRIHHNSGILYPGEDIIYVVVLGGHRHEIWPPLEESMELIKKELPIWKKEVYLNGEMWVHDNQLKSHDNQLKSHDNQLKSHDNQLKSHDNQLKSHDNQLK